MGQVWQMQQKRFLFYEKIDRCLFTLVDLGMKCVQVRMYILD